MNYELRRKRGVKWGVWVFPIFSLLLLGISCKSKYGSVSVNVNAAAGAVINAAKSVNTNSVKQVVTREAAVIEAKAIYVKLESQGTDFSQGPCISNNLLPDWVADVAHNPRQPVDDQPANQCSAYREGQARHFVELDPDGQLIRAQ
ncbi:MAG: hypothetical protein HY420_00365 [Candidatus Kerfeldbacteria bacterium]|nr:hypothetical protein [Candidatus Kerfeldbacteria bacterium]